MIRYSRADEAPSRRARCKPGAATLFVGFFSCAFFRCAIRQTDRTPAAHGPENRKETPMSTGEKTVSADAARLRAAPRCGARTRAGTSCRSPAVHGRSHCRMHGCGGGKLHRSGAPHGNRNAWKDGCWAAAARVRRRQMTAFIRDMEARLADIEAISRSPTRAFGGPASGAWGCFPFFLSDAAPPAPGGVVSGAAWRGT